MHSHILSLENILASSADKLQQLLQLLKIETEVLTKNNIDELENITQKKIILTEQIEKLEQQRIDCLTQKTLDPNKPKQWLQTKNLISLWKKIKSVAADSKKQNQVNGLVINGNRNRIKTQIEILSTSSLPAVAVSYSSSGESIQQRDSKTIALA